MPYSYYTSSFYTLSLPQRSRYPELTQNSRISKYGIRYDVLYSIFTIYRNNDAG